MNKKYQRLTELPVMHKRAGVKPMEAFLKNTVPVMEFKPFRETIYEYLRQQILSGNLRAGILFSDGEIAELFKTSRTPVREAVQKLEAEGLVERLPMKGNIVKGLSPVEIAHIYSIRKALELLAIRYATLRITPEELDTMKTILDGVDTLLALKDTDNLAEKLLQPAGEFNNVLFNACRVPKLIQMIWQHRELLDRYRTMRIVISKQLGERFVTRRRVYRAFLEKDMEKAVAAWEEHLETSFHIWLESSGLDAEKARGEYL
jgi:DNA-binding GntR family transcriptional regulator